MDCEICRWNHGKTIYWINRKRHCSECAASVFQNRWLKLKTRFTNLNKKFKKIQAEGKAPVEI